MYSDFYFYICNCWIKNHKAGIEEFNAWQTKRGLKFNFWKDLFSPSLAQEWTPYTLYTNRHDINADLDYAISKKKKKERKRKSKKKKKRLQSLEKLWPHNFIF